MTIKQFCVFSLLLLSALCFSNCGHQETAGTLVGGGAGAVLGAALGGEKHAGTGALIGALGGMVAGGAAGRSADDEDREIEQEYKDRVVAHHQATMQRRIESMEEENEQLKRRWCDSCNRICTLTGANSCPACGGALIKTRYCRECSSTFSPETGFHYCPYCKPGRQLAAR